MVTVEIPDTVTEIGEYAFYEWKNLEKVIMSSNITSIGEDAFGGCNNLTNITYNGTQSQWNNISKDGWSLQSSIKAVTCTDGVIQIN